MNKINAEYSNLIDDNLPNLWNRIDAAITQIDDNPGENSSDSLFDIKPEGKNQPVSNADFNKASKKLKGKNLYRFGGFVAAAAVLVIGFNVFSRNNMFNLGVKSENTSAPANTANSEAYAVDSISSAEADYVYFESNTEECSEFQSEESSSYDCESVLSPDINSIFAKDSRDAIFSQPQTKVEASSDIIISITPDDGANAVTPITVTGFFTDSFSDEDYTYIHFIDSTDQSKEYLLILNPDEVIQENILDFNETDIVTFNLVETDDPLGKYSPLYKPIP